MLYGAALLRLSGVSLPEKASIVAATLEEYAPELPKAFMAVSPATIRIRRARGWVMLQIFLSALESKGIMYLMPMPPFSSWLRVAFLPQKNSWVMGSLRSLDSTKQYAVALE